jgi:hypothetical protein
MPEPEKSRPSSMKRRVGRSVGALKGISISMRPFGPEEVNALVWDELGAAGEDGVAAGEVEQGGGEAVGVEVGIAVDEAARRGWAAGRIRTRGLDAVTADVVEGAAAGFRDVADVGGVGIEVAEEGGDGAEGADAAFVEELRGGEATAGGSGS